MPRLLAFLLLLPGLLLPTGVSLHLCLCDLLGGSCSQVKASSAEPAQPRCPRCRAHRPATPESESTGSLARTDAQKRCNCLTLKIARTAPTDLPQVLGAAQTLVLAPAEAARVGISAPTGLATGPTNRPLADHPTRLRASRVLPLLI